MASLTQARALEVLSLDIETGALTWRISLGSRAQKGQRAGCLHKASGYRFVDIDGVKYREHVLIWYMLKGEWLPRKIDHHDRDRANNRPINLRRATESEQRSNAKLRADNALGFRNVHLHLASGLYMAEVRREGKRIAKYFKTIPEAVIAAKNLRKEMFGQFAPSYDFAGGN